MLKFIDTCGDSQLYDEEECDDGNKVSGDGCSSDCKIETKLGFTCTTEATKKSKCTDKCGDGIRSPNEECDDGNTDPEDGCSDECKEEADLGWKCVGATGT